MPRPIHFELPYTNPEKNAKFFTDVFGWSFHKWDGPQPYWLAQTGDTSKPGINGGLMFPMPNFPEKTPILILDVPDVREYISRVTTGGGNVLTEVITVPGVGYLAYFLDPGGILFGMMQSDEKAAE